MTYDGPLVIWLNICIGRISSNIGAVQYVSSEIVGLVH